MKRFATYSEATECAAQLCRGTDEPVGIAGDDDGCYVVVIGDAALGCGVRYRRMTEESHIIRRKIDGALFQVRVVTPRITVATNIADHADTVKLPVPIGDAWEIVGKVES